MNSPASPESPSSAPKIFQKFHPFGSQYATPLPVVGADALDKVVEVAPFAGQPGNDGPATGVAGDLMRQMGKIFVEQHFGVLGQGLVDQGQSLLENRE